MGIKRIIIAITLSTLVAFNAMPIYAEETSNSSDTQPAVTTEATEGTNYDKTWLDANWNYYEKDGNIYLTQYKGTNLDVVIPGLIDGKQVYIKFSNPGTVNNFFKDKDTTLNAITFKEVNSTKVKVYGPSLEAFAFNLTALTSFDGSGLDVSNVTDLSRLFDECSHLTNIELSNWDTSNVTTTYEMFKTAGITSTEEISKWDTTSLTNTERMFWGCDNLTTLDLSGWNTSKLTTTWQMFYDCMQITTLDSLANWDTSSLDTLNSMFWGCSQLKDISALGEWKNTKSFRLLGGLFHGCSSLSDISPLADWDTSNVTQLWVTFYGCKSLQFVTALKDWDVSNVTDLEQMFNHCDHLKAVDLSGWKLAQENVTTTKFIDSQQPLLVVANDEKLTGYSYKTDNIATYNTLKSGEGHFPNSSSSVTEKHDFVVSDISDETIDGVIEQAKEAVAKSPGNPVKDNDTFVGWKANDLPEVSTENADLANLENAYNKVMNTYTAVWKSTNKAPTITAEDKTINVGDSFDPMNGVSADDEEDGDLTSSVTVEGTVNTDQAGKYELTYSVTDSAGEKTTKTVTVTVNAYPEINAEDKTIIVGDTFNPLADVTATDKEDGELTTSIIASGNVDTSTDGSYKITYIVTDSNGASTEKTITVTVLPKFTPGPIDPVIPTDPTLPTEPTTDPSTPTTDPTTPTVPSTSDTSNESPVINAEDKTINAGDDFDPTDGVTATDKEDGDLTPSIKVDGNVDTSTPGSYEITYTVTDKDGATTTKTITVTVTKKESKDNTSGKEKKRNKKDTGKTNTTGSNDEDKNSSSSTKNASAPKTGDTPAALYYVILLTVAAGALTVVVYERKRKNQK